MSWLSGKSQSIKESQTALAQAGRTETTAPAATQFDSTARPALTEVQTSNEAQTSSFEEGYRAGYQDARRDCEETRASVARTATRTRYVRRTPRVRVASARYYNEGHRGHSTRNMILRIAAPAAIGAGIGAIAGGGKGAGAGALIGGGAGAIYHLFKSRR
jgi:hypothetical protein